MTSRAQQVATAIEDELLAARTPVGTSLGRRTDLMERHGVSPTVMNETLRFSSLAALSGLRALRCGRSSIMP